MRVAKLTNHALEALIICDNLSVSPDWGSSGSVKHVIRKIYT